VNYIAMILSLFAALIIHEMAHSAAAWYCGDHVSRIEGRLGLNPARHFDLFGSLFMPLFLYLVSSPFLIGYARPVRVNALNFRSRRPGLFTVAIAGPLSNLILAAISYYALMNFDKSGENFISQFLYFFLTYNVILACFNLLPFPPLDGSNIIKAAIPQKLATVYIFLEPFFIVVFIGLLVSGALGDYIRPFIEFMINFIGNS
jgi:Zn-dependent protease